MRRQNSAKVSGVALALALACVGIAGCEPYEARRDTITSEVGNAVAHNIAVQTIDPWSPTSGNQRIDVDGEKVLVAADRYKAGKVIPPKGLSTTQGVNK